MPENHSSNKPLNDLVEDDAMQARVLRKVSWKLFPFMMLLYTVNYLDRINISFAGPAMKDALGFNDEMFGLGAGLFFIGYFLFGIPSNKMLMRFGARRWIAVITFLWGIVSVSMSLVRDAHWFYIVRTLLGVTESGFFPGMILYLTFWFPKREHAKAVARFMAAIPVAGVLGGLTSSQVLLMNGYLGLAGWKWLFIITGTPAILLGFVVLFVLKDSPQQCPWLAEDERNWLVNKIEAEKKQKMPDSSSDAVKASPTQTENVFCDPRIWHLAAIHFFISLGMYGFQLWLPQILKNFDNLSDSKAAMFSAIPAIFQALGMIIVAGNSDRTRERRRHAAASATLAAVALFSCGFNTSSPLISLGLLSLAAFGIWGTVGPFWALPTFYLSPSSSGVGIGLINSIGSLGGFSGPYLVGYIKEHTPGFIYSLAALAVSLVVAATLCLAVRQTSNNEV